MPFAVLLLVSLTSAAPAADPATEKAWLALLHYRGGRSQADGPGFFLSPRGKTDPRAELEADLEAFRSGGDAGCRFPARLHWLRRRLGEDLPRPSCPRFEAWRAALDAESVSLVYADAFMGNPASMYGHTFLRLKRRGYSSSLLDYTISFAGNPDTGNALFYALKGVFGAFPGTYSTVPYYMKTQEYNNVESRDLWEYELALSPEAVEQLVRHAWEMGSTHFDYWFFSENCSYQLLTLLDAADPALLLSPRFGFGTIPSDTVRAALARRELVRERRYRPSHVQEMIARRALLTSREASAARGADLSVIGSLPAHRRPFVLDSAHDYMRYKAGFGPGLDAAERPLLAARAKLRAPPSEAKPVEPAPLEAGHGTARLGLGAGVSSHAPFYEVSFRAALRDLAGDASGYSAGSQLEMGHVRLRFDGSERVPYLERAAVVDIVSLTPLDPWIRKASWRVSAGVEQAKELGKSPVDSMAPALSPGGGVAWAPDLPLRPLLYVFADAEAGAAPALPRGWRLGAGGSGGLLLRPLPRWRLLAEASYRKFGQDSPDAERVKLTSSWTLARDWELRAVLDRRTPDSEAGASVLLHF